MIIQHSGCARPWTSALALSVAILSALSAQVGRTQDQSSQPRPQSPSAPPAQPDSSDQPQDLHSLPFPPALLDAANQAKEKLLGLNVHRVMISDFQLSGDNTLHGAFADWLADGVAQKLSSDPDALTVSLQGDLQVVRTISGYMPDISQVDSVVDGILSADPAGIRLTLTVFRKSDWLNGVTKTGNSVETVIPIEDSFVSWVPLGWRRKSISNTVEDSSTSIARAGTNGVGVPTCIYCSDPKFPEPGRRRKTMGTVVLQVIVEPDGTATDIKVLRRIGYGLDEAAVEAVRNWKFRPALDQEGRPTRVMVITEINFRLL